MGHTYVWLLTHMVYTALICDSLGTVMGVEPAEPVTWIFDNLGLIENECINVHLPRGLQQWADRLKR